MSKSTLFPIFAFPIILALGILIIPVNTDYNDHALAVQAVELTERWFVGHLISAIAFSFSIWASREILGVLQKAPWFTPIFISFGAGLYAAGLGADGIGPVAVKASGESAIIFFDGSGWWVSGVFMAATLFFGIGLFIIISNSIQYHLIKGIWRYIIFVSALVFVAAPAIPSGWGLYGVAIAAIGILFPIGFAVHRTA
ncbi:MAG: hypothetical protein IMY85_01760 [Chloroflexi bacterium]|nr:hypothetical protein [Chloroflexota bacterium]